MTDNASRAIGVLERIGFSKFKVFEDGKIDIYEQFDRTGDITLALASEGVTTLEIVRTPGFGGTQRLARLVSPGMAKQLIYTARNIKAAEAYRIGLVNQVVSAEVNEAGEVVTSAKDALMAAANKMAAGIAQQAPIAVRNCKKAINEGLQVDMDKAIVIEEKLFGDCFETEDQKAGMGNFLEKDKEKKLKVVPFQNK